MSTREAVATAQVPRRKHRGTAKTRQRIVDAARDLMTERDRLEVSIAEITELAGVNIAAVNYHFGGREELMVCIAEADAEIAVQELAKLLASDLPIDRKMHRHITGIVLAYFEKPYLHRLLHQLIRDGSPSATSAVIDCFVEPVTRARTEMLEEGIKDGTFRNIRPDHIGYAIEGACAQIFTSSASREAVLGEGELTQEVVYSYAESVADLIVSGLLRHDADSSQM